MCDCGLLNYADHDECSNVNRCQQSCVNTQGGYECQCTEGYFADMETSTCKAEGRHVAMI